MQLLGTQSSRFAKARTANATDTSFPSKIPTATEPSGTGVVELIQNKLGGPIQNSVLVVAFGAGSDDTTFSVRVIGWRLFGDDPQTQLWIPAVLAELACTLSSAVGVAGKVVVNTERFADTITLVTGNDDISIDIVSPTGNVVAHAAVDIKGFQKLEFTFDLTGATDANVLYSMY